MFFGNRVPTLSLFMLLGSLFVDQAHADWPRFLGPNGEQAAVASNIPAKWDLAKNLKWSVKLDGEGSSSPIIVGDKIFLTSYTSSTTDGKTRADRNLHCFKLANGEKLWTTTIRGEQDEDPLTGFMREHGYASSTPTSDGTLIYAFFGKAGVFAFDMDGQEKWRVSVGTNSSSRRWGSGASLVLHDQTLIINASDESQSLIALDKETGKEKWKIETGELSYSTPAVRSLGDGKTELIIPMTDETWGINIENGKLRWFAKTGARSNVSPSPILDNEVVYLFGGLNSNAVSFKLGGRDDITESGKNWSTRSNSYVATPLLHAGHLFWVDDRGIANCLEAATGKQIYQERIPNPSEGRVVYASPVVVGDKIVVPTRRSGVLVLPAEPRFEVLALNEFPDDDSDFNASPAAEGDFLYLRSNRFLYCIGN